MRKVPHNGQLQPLYFGNQKNGTQICHNINQNERDLRQIIVNAYRTGGTVKAMLQVTIRFNNVKVHWMNIQSKGNMID